SFGAGGTVTTDIRGTDSSDAAWSVALQPDGKLVVAGSTAGPSGDAFALARYTPTGALDTTFGSSGRVITGFGGDQDWAQAVAVQADGKIVAAGKTGHQCCGGTFDFALARYTAGGTPDTTFGTGGKVTTDFAGSTDNAHALVIQADGKILAGGERLPGGNASGASFDFALARYQPGGALDPAFGAGGLVTTDFPGHNDHTYALALQQDGRVVAAGDSSPDFALARYAAATVNNPPAARDDSYATAEDTPLTVAAPGVLGNDSDADGDPLSVPAASVTAPAHGTAAVNADGSFTYTPAADFNGTDTFTYHASDGTAPSTAATVTITVTPVNDPPAARDDNYATAEDTPLTVPAPGVLGNDSDADGDPLSVPAASVTAPAHGTAAVNADGSFTYTPAADYNGTDSITYHASDGTAPSTAATVTITVTPVNDPPAARDDNYRTEEDTPLSTTASKMAGVLANDSDADGDPLTAVLVTGPAHGTLSLNSNGSFTYTPAAGFSGTDSFTYRATDGVLGSNAATVTITVVRPGTPVAVDDSYRTGQDTPLMVPPPGVLANDSDPNGDPLRIEIRSVTAPAHGTLNLSKSDGGDFTYTPATGFTGQDSFTYRATDGVLGSNVATVTITVAPKIVFASTRDGNSEIYVMNSDGSGVTRLTTNPATDTPPVWSPNHRKIAFISTRDGNPRIYVMNADGTALTRLPDKFSGIDATPAWSPDGTKIAFAGRAGSNWDIYVMNADGTALTRLTSNPAIDATPAWAPGGKIAFASTRDKNSEIYLMPAAGEVCKPGCTAATRLTTNSATDTSPTWLGTRIAFASTRDDPNSEIYVMNADGTAVTRLTANPASDTFPDW